MLNVLEPRDEFQILETVENDTHCIYLYYSPHDATTLLCVASDEETSRIIRISLELALHQNPKIDDERGSS